jgi:DNA-directed RNA polymerase subunit RPC12/RpoP
MRLACPKCNRQLPEVENLKYRFCPHCGAEIAVDQAKREEAFLTIPPGLAPRQSKQRPENSSLDAQTGKKPSLTGRFNEQTIAPQPMAGRPQPELKPPETPPPASFFRTPAKRIKPHPQEFHPQPPAKNRNKIIIVVLVSLAAVILIIGGLFTF